MAKNVKIAVANTGFALGRLTYELGASCSETCLRKALECYLIG